MYLAFIHIGRYDIKARRHLACVQNGITQLGDWRMETWLHPPSPSLCNAILNTCPCLLAITINVHLWRNDFEGQLLVHSNASYRLTVTCFVKIDFVITKRLFTAYSYWSLLNKFYDTAMWFVPRLSRLSRPGLPKRNDTGQQSFCLFLR